MKMGAVIPDERGPIVGIRHVVKIRKTLDVVVILMRRIAIGVGRCPFVRLVQFQGPSLVVNCTAFSRQTFDNNS